jgi:hypothetical protein
MHAGTGLEGTGQIIGRDDGMTPQLATLAGCLMKNMPRSTAQTKENDPCSQLVLGASE